MLEEELPCQRDELLLLVKRKTFPPRRRHSEELSSRREERRDGRETQGENACRGGAGVGQGVASFYFFIIILQIFWNVVNFYS